MIGWSVVAVQTTQLQTRADNQSYSIYSFENQLKYRIAYVSQSKSRNIGSENQSEHHNCGNPTCDEHQNCGNPTCDDAAKLPVLYTETQTLICLID